jgi:hypothetical protein
VCNDGERKDQNIKAMMHLKHVLKQRVHWFLRSISSVHQLYEVWTGQKGTLLIANKEWRKQTTNPLFSTLKWH